MQDDIIKVGRRLPRIRQAIPLDGRKVHVMFDNGLEKVVDLAPALKSRHFYVPLYDDDTLFRSFHISEYGGAIEWKITKGVEGRSPDGESKNILDFSAVWLERLPDISFSNTDFRQAMDRLDMSLDGMAIALDISRRQVANYRKDKPIPRHIALATRYLVEHQP